MRVTSKGQVTIPKPIRDRLGIGPGSRVEFIEQDNDVVLVKQGRGVFDAAAFDAWAARVAGTIDTQGMDGKTFVDWLRGPRDDLDAD